MTARDFERFLKEAIEEICREEGETCRVRTYEETGVLTRDRGLVVKLRKGDAFDEFDLTIQQRRSAEDEEETDEPEVDEPGVSHG